MDGENHSPEKTWAVAGVLEGAVRASWIVTLSAVWLTNLEKQKETKHHHVLDFLVILHPNLPSRFPVKVAAIHEAHLL